MKLKKKRFWVIFREETALFRYLVIIQKQPSELFFKKSVFKNHRKRQENTFAFFY